VVALTEALLCTRQIIIGQFENLKEGYNKERN